MGKSVFEEIMRTWGEVSKGVHIPTPNCLSSAQIIGYIDKHLKANEMQRLTEHISQCEYCSSEVKAVSRAQALYRSKTIDSRELPKSKVKKLIENLVEKAQNLASWLRIEPTEPALAAESSMQLSVSVFDEEEGEKEVYFTVRSGPEVDKEGQLALSLIAPDDTYNGREIDLALMLNENRRLLLATPLIYGKNVHILLDIGLASGMAIPLDWFTASIRDRVVENESD